MRSVESNHVASVVLIDRASDIRILRALNKIARALQVSYPVYIAGRRVGHGNVRALLSFVSLAVSVYLRPPYYALP